MTRAAGLRTAATVLALLLALVTEQARAAGPPREQTGKHVVLLLPIEAEGLLAADREALEQRLRPAFEHPDLDVITPSEVEPCGDGACLLELGREHGASHVIRTTIVADGRDYLAQIDVLVVADDEHVDTVDASCRICGLAEFDDRLAARAVAAREWILATPRVGRLEIVGRPADARVRIDGQLRGSLPYAGELSVGAHELVVIAGGHFRQSIPIDTLAGVSQRLEVQLAPKPMSPWHRSAGWATLGVGLGSLTTGAILIAVHGQPATLRCDSGEPTDIDGDGDCRWLRRTLGVGVGLTAIGAAAATVGVTLLTIDARRRRAHEHTTDRAQIGALIGLDRVALRIRF